MCSSVSKWMDSGYGSYLDALFVELPSLPQGRWVLTQGFLPDGALQPILTLEIGRSCDPGKCLFYGTKEIASVRPFNWILAGLGSGRGSISIL